MIIFEPESKGDFLDSLVGDPYAIAGLFESVSVKPRRPAVGRTFS